MSTDRFTSVVFTNFKAFKQYSVAVSEFNVLVGPNNSGKSTVIAAFRILGEALRKARSRSPVPLRGPDGNTFGYRIDLSTLPVAAENIFCDYNDSQPASVRFRVSNGNHLTLYFPETGTCFLIPDAPRVVRSPSAFRAEFDCSVGFVPVLGPVEHNEPLYKKDAARQALITHTASRNFRNIWHHFPTEFEGLRDLLRATWPGMDIERPKVDYSGERTRLHMFCVEGRIPRELFWAGFGFQVWCQMLTFILEAREDSLLVIDEPDIYLHSDLQRQLLTILKTTRPDVLIATHSTEIVGGADPDDILLVSKTARSATRLRNPGQLQRVFETLGSNLNPTLTQLAKTRRVLFVEGKDFQILSWFAEVLGFRRVAMRSDFAVIPADGFNSAKVRDVSVGIEATLGAKVLRAVVFDRDYRSSAEAAELASALSRDAVFAHIHECKEIENFLLIPAVIQRALNARLKERKLRGAPDCGVSPDVADLLDSICDEFRPDAQANYVASYVKFAKSVERAKDETTLTREALLAFETAWRKNRFEMVPGKTALAALNQRLLDSHHVSLSANSIVRSFRCDEVPEAMTKLLSSIDAFAKTLAP